MIRGLAERTLVLVLSVPVVAGFSLTGCSALALWSMSEEDCRAADWQALGFEDRTDGKTPLAVSRYRETCGDYAVMPDVAAYEEGRTRGVRQYCRPANGLAVGESGAQYTGVCPSELETAFLQRYAAGNRIKQAKDRISGTISEISRVERRYEKVSEKFARREAALIGQRMSREERAATVADTLELAQELGKLELELAQLRADRFRHEADLERIRIEVLAY